MPGTWNILRRRKTFLGPRQAAHHVELTPSVALGLVGRPARFAFLTVCSFSVGDRARWLHCRAQERPFPESCVILLLRIPAFLRRCRWVMSAVLLMSLSHRPLGSLSQRLLEARVVQL